MRFWKIRTTFDPEPILEYGLNKGLLNEQNNAYYAIDSVLQLLCVQAESAHISVPFVLPAGEIHDMYVILNNFHQAKNPFGFDMFCRKHFQLHYHYHKFEPHKSDLIDVAAGCIYTAGQLEGAFPIELSELLQTRISENPEYKQSAAAMIWAKSWQHEMFQPTTHALTRLSSRWTQLVD